MQQPSKEKTIVLIDVRVYVKQNSDMDINGCEKEGLVARVWQ